MVDIDSIYFGSHQFESLVKGLGSQCCYTVTSMLERTGTATGSRFALDNRRLQNDPITGRGLSINTVNLSRVPHVLLARCSLTGTPTHPTYIYLHWLGISRVRKKIFFTFVELAFINMVMNITRLRLVNTSSTRQGPDSGELGKLKMFETKVKGPSEHILQSKMYRLGCESMGQFAKTFDSTLAWFGDLDRVEFEVYVTKELTGMNFEGPIGQRLNMRHMRSFCISLANNCYFAASLAGCKGIFHNKPSLCFKLQTEAECTIENLQEVVHSATSEIYRIAREELLVCDFPRSENDGDIQYHFDFGYEVSALNQDDLSFLLSGTKAYEAFTEYLRQPRPHVAFQRDTPPAGYNNHPEEANDEIAPVGTIHEFDDEPELMDEEDYALFQTGESRPPHEARHIREEGSDDGEK